MSFSPGSDSTNVRSWRRDLLLLVLGFGLLLAFKLGSAPLANPDEGRYAEIPREMVATGDWVTPRLDGVNYFEKPPLLYWTGALCYKFLGSSEWSMRAGPALFALAGILLTYAAARRLHDRETGLVSAAVLGTTLLYYALGRLLILDMAVSVLMSAALFCFILGVREAPGARRRWLFYGLYTAMALATLTKGLIGFLVTGAVMFLWLLLFNQWHRLRPLYLPSGAMLFLAIALPWHVLAAQHNPTWFHRYIIFEHWERFTTPAAGRVQPWHFFIWVTIAGMFPWTGFLWRPLRDLVRTGWRARHEHAEAWYLVTWAGFILFFFSISHSKLIPYILPVFPAVAVLIGAGIVKTMREGTPRFRAGFGFFAGFGLLLAVALFVVALKPGLIRDPDQAAAIRPYAIGLGAILIMGVVQTIRSARRRGPVLAFTSLGITTVLMFGVLVYATPWIQRPGTKDLALYVAAHAAPGDRIVHYREFFHDFTFYTRRLVDLAETKSELELEEDAAARASGRFYDDATFRRHWAEPARMWVVIRKRDAHRLMDDPAFHYQLRGETRGHYLLSNRP